MYRPVVSRSTRPSIYLGAFRVPVVSMTSGCVKLNDVSDPRACRHLESWRRRPHRHPKGSLEPVRRRPLIRKAVTP